MIQKSNGEGSWLHTCLQLAYEDVTVQNSPSISLECSYIYWKITSLKSFCVFSFPVAKITSQYHEKQLHAFYQQLVFVFFNANRVMTNLLLADPLNLGNDRFCKHRMLL